MTVPGFSFLFLGNIIAAVNAKAKAISSSTAFAHKPAPADTSLFSARRKIMKVTGTAKASPLKIVLTILQGLFAKISKIAETNAKPNPTKINAISQFIPFESTPKIVHQIFDFKDVTQTNFHF